MKIMGVLDYIHHDRSFGKVEALLEAEGPSWRPAKGSDYPPDGRIFWSRPPATVASGVVVQATIEENHADKKSEGQGDKKRPPDAYRLQACTFPVEVLDLRGLGTLDTLRRSLDSGLRLPTSPQAQVLLWATDGIVGPVRLVESSKGWSLEDSARPQLALYKPTELQLLVLNSKSGPRAVLGSSGVPAPAAYVDWGTDEDVLRRALAHAATHAKRENRHQALTKAVIAEAAADSTVDGTPAQVQLYSYRLARAQSYLETAGSLSSHADQLAELVRTLPAYQEQLEKALAAARADAAKKVDLELQAEKAQLALLQQRKEALNQELAAAEASVASAQSKFEQQVGALEGELLVRARAALEAPQKLLAEVALFRALGWPGQPSAVSQQASPPPVLRRALQPWDIGTSVIRSAAELRTALVPHASAAGVNPMACVRLHSALAARSVPVLTGPRAVETAEVYARAAAGGRVLTVPITPEARQAADIFGEVRGTRYTPHAAGLIDFLNAAATSKGLAVVVLEGINRAPAESVLLPLVRLVLGRTGTLPLFHPSAVDAADPYRDSAAVAWPDNVLLVTTVTDGPTSLPVSVQLWPDAAVIRCKIGEAAQVVQPSLASAVFDLAPEFCQRHFSPQRDEGVKHTFATLDADASEPDELADLADVAARLSHALVFFQSDSQERLKELVRMCLAPAIASVASLSRREQLAAAVERATGLRDFPVLRVVESARRSVA